MSAAPGLERALVRGPRRVSARRPRLALVPAARPATGGPARRSPFVAVVVTLLAAGLLGLLMLNTTLAQDAFTLHTLKQDSRALEDQEEALRREVEALQAPRELAARATDLGMVPAGPPAFLRLSDGEVLGSATPAGVPDASAEQAPLDPDVPAEPADEASDQASDDAADAPADDAGEGQ